MIERFHLNDWVFRSCHGDYPGKFAGVNVFPKQNETQAGVPCCMVTTLACRLISIGATRCDLVQSKTAWNNPGVCASYHVTHTSEATCVPHS